MPRNRIEAKHKSSVHGFGKVNLAGFGPTKDRALAGAGNGRSFFETDQFDFSLALATPTIERSFRTPNYQQTLSLDRDPCSPLFHAHTFFRGPLLGKRQRRLWLAVPATIERSEVLIVGQHAVLHSHKIVKSDDGIDR